MTMKIMTQERKNKLFRQYKKIRTENQIEQQVILTEILNGK